MTQTHYKQLGTFHITTNARSRVPWLTWDGVPEILIDNLVMTRNIHKAKLYAFCIMPNHMHLILSPGEKGLSKFMQSFKKNSMRDVNTFLGKYSKNNQSDFRIAPTECDNQRRGESKFAVSDLSWQKGFHDERIRDSAQRSHTLGYVQYNPIKDNLVESIDDWSWTSLHFQELLDPMDFWFDSPYDPM